MFVSGLGLVFCHHIASINVMPLLDYASPVCMQVEWSFRVSYKKGMLVSIHIMVFPGEHLL